MPAHDHTAAAALAQLRASASTLTMRGATDQYISFATSLPADPTLYGLGEHKTGIKLTNGIRCFVAPAARIQL